jgi:hypothetical protein
MNPARDIKITKTKCREKVDGAVALAMAVGSRPRLRPGRSTREDRAS